MEKIYNYSEEQIKKSRKIQILFLSLFFLTVVLGSIFLGGLETIGYFLIFFLAVTMILVIIIVVVLSPVINNRLRKTKIILSDEDIGRQAGESLELIRYEDLTKVKVLKVPSGKVKAIKLVSPGSSFIIAGFEHMDELAEGIIERLEDSSILLQKNEKLDFNNPIVFVVFFVSIVVVLMFIGKISSDMSMILNNGIFIAFGIFYIFSRPFSKSIGKKFIILDLIIGGIILFSGVNGLYEYFLYIY